MNPRSEAALRISRNIGQNVRRLRGELGLSAQGLADRTQGSHHPMSREVLGTVERGRHPNGLALKSVSVEELAVLAHALGVSPLVLMNAPEGT